MTLTMATISGSFLTPGLTKNSARVTISAAGGALTGDGKVIRSHYVVPVAADGTATVTLPQLPQAAIDPSDAMWELTLSPDEVFTFQLTGNATWDDIYAAAGGPYTPNLVTRAESAAATASAAATSASTSASSAAASASNALSVSGITTSLGVIAGALQFADVRDKGATGNGSTDDTTAFTTAIATGAKKVNVSAGTYIVNGLTMNQAGQRLVLAPGATLKAKTGGSQTLVTVTAAGAGVVAPSGGATIDGNSVGTTAGNAVYLHAADATASGLSFVNIGGIGIVGDGDRVKIADNTLTNTAAASIVVTNQSGVDLSSPVVVGNRVSMASGTLYGIQIYSQGGRKVIRPRVSGNDVTLPALVGSGICIELQAGISRGTVNGNTVTGGSIGISIDTGSGVSVTGNSAFGSFTNAIELAGCERCTVTGNTVDGNAVTATGLSVTNGGNGLSTLSGNTVGNLGAAGRGVYGTGTSDVGTIVTGNTLVAFRPILFDGGTNLTITGNLLVSANTSNAGVELNNVQTSIVANNTCSGFTSAAVNAYTGTFAGLIIGPNILTGGTPADLQNGWTPGTNGTGSRLIRGNIAPPAIAATTPSASPWTYTNTTLNQVNLYLFGGTVSLVKRGTTTVATASPCDVLLNPGDTVVVTYSVVPTAIVDQK